ncbi:7617_t:CDS:2, partial [Acaulospora morrowiae]
GAENREPESRKKEGAENREPENRKKEDAEGQGQGIATKKLTTKIYFEEAREFKAIQLSSSMTALDVLTFFRSNHAITDADAWTLFEFINDLDLERPLRDWECVSKVIGTWELGRNNSLVLKKYPYRSSLTLNGFNNATPP